MNFEFPVKLGFLFKPARYKGAHGGRGSAKSWGFARCLLILGYQRPLKILCVREFQNSLDESVKALLETQIQKMGLDEFYKVSRTEIVGANGTRFIFEGVKHNTPKIKSMEDVDVMWAEEADNISEESWQILIPTIRKPGSEIWLTWNPKSKHDATHRRFIDAPPENAHIIEMSWRDNPWFPEELRQDMEECKRRSMAEYLHVWEGHTREEAGDTRFKPSWDKFWAPERWDRYNRYITVDPANSKGAKSDYTVFTVWGLGADRNAYVIEWIRDRLDVYERVQTIFRLHKKYTPLNIGWEHTGMSGDIAVIEHEQNVTGYRFPVTALKPPNGVSKESRIEAALLPLLSEGRLYVPSSCIYINKAGEQQDLTREYLKEKDAFPLADGDMIHDDILDSMAHLMHPDMAIKWPNTGMEPRRRPGEYDPASYGFERPRRTVREYDAGNYGF